MEYDEDENQQWRGGRDEHPDGNAVSVSGAEAVPSAAAMVRRSPVFMLVAPVAMLSNQRIELADLETGFAIVFSA